MIFYKIKPLKISMIQLRSTLFALFLLIFTPIWSVLCMLAFPILNPENRYRFIGLWNKIVIWLLWHLCGIRYEIRGMENMRAVLDQPVVVLSKHQSAYETIAYIALLPKQLCFVFKRELLWIPFFGWALALLKMIHINRADKETAATSVASQGRKRLKEGKWIMLFPEGTRIPTGSHVPYRKGGARLASATNAIVIPIAHNAGRCWPKNSFLKYPGTVIFSIGPAISSAGKTAGQLHQEVEQWIETEMHVIDPSAYQT
jgi:1-acyl-sn-glycerol-3-phosphate acyltransferase